MGSVFEYIKRYGNKSFLENEFNEIDAAIMALLSYIDFNKVVADDKVKIKLEYALEYFLNYADMKVFYKSGFIQKDLIRLSKYLKDSLRYKEVLVYGYVNKVNDSEQFGALSLKLPDGKIVISFQGTDESLSGWKEDLALCYKFPVPAQLDAINYANKYISFFDKEVILVGHSKGGHLALVAGMYVNPLLKWKIKKIYNFDGPGLRKKQFESRKFKSIENKMIHIIPNYSLFGLLLRHNKKYISVKANKIGFMAHSIFSWEINKCKFKREVLSLLSKNLDKSIIMWLENHTDEERERITEDVFDYLKKVGITDFVGIMKFKNILSLVKRNAELDKQTKDMLINFIKFNLEYHINNIDDIELV